MTLRDGRTPGQFRNRVPDIMRALNAGCKIYPNPRNRIPDEWHVHLLDLNPNVGPVDQPITDPVPDILPEPVKRRPGRPKKQQSVPAK